MSDEDMTCLFCGRGGVSVMVVDEVTDPGCDIANVPIYATSCPYCGARGPMALSEDEAVAAWNRRTERTCNVESLYPAWGENDTWYEIKLSCGDSFPWWEGYPPDFCPCCGREVVGQ